MYSIILLDKIPPVYEDMALMLANTIIEKGSKIIIYIFMKPEQYTETSASIEGTRIFLGQLVSEVSIPDGSIICDFDPVKVDMLSRLPYQTLINNTILCYSTKVIQNIIQEYPEVKNIGKFQYGYSRFLDINSIKCRQYFETNFEVLPEEKKDIDVAFLMGSYEYPRRLQIINTLLKCGVNVYHSNRAYRADRIKIYNRSKIILSVYSKEENFCYSSGSRIFPAVSSGNFVISEKCTDPDEHSELQQICINVEYDKLVSTVLYYLKNVNERLELTSKFYNNIKGYITNLNN